MVIDSGATAKDFLIAYKRIKRLGESKSQLLSPHEL